MSDLEFRVLGPVEMLRQGEPVAVGSTTLALLAGLLLSPNHAVSASRLAEILWGERQPVRPRAAVHSAVSRLRRLLGGDTIERLSGGYRLHVSSSQLDLLRSDSLTAAARAAVCRGADEEAADALATAISLWREPVLGNIDSAALQGDAARLAERRIVLYEEWAELCLGLGRHPTVAETLPALVRVHPFRERLVGQLMTALFHCGRRADALAAFDSLRTCLREELGIDPGCAVKELHVQILRADVPAQVRARDGQHADTPGTARPALPPWRGRKPLPDGLVGRGRDIDTLAEAVLTQRAVTLTGTAGVGKTALALATAGRLAGVFPDGVSVVELGMLPAQQVCGGPEGGPAVGRALAVAQAVRHTLGDTPLPARETDDALIAGLQRLQMLLVLDNAEHVAAACARLVDLIVRSCQGVKVLTTSRRRLGLGSEVVIELSPLPAGRAAELLKLRAAGHRPGPDLGADPAGVAELCRLVEGLPLALELAAARLRTMCLRALLDRIGSRPGLLAVHEGAALPHQRGLHATLQWSYDLLTDDSGLLLRRLAVFTGPFTLDGAERVCGFEPLTENDVAGILARLVDDCLVRAEQGGDGYFYRLLIPVREFALARLSAGDLGTARGRHLRYSYEVTSKARPYADRGALSDVTALEHGFSDLLAFSSLPPSTDPPTFADLLAAWEWALRSEAGREEAELGARLLLAARPAWERHSGAASCVLDHVMRALSHRARLPAPLVAHLTLLAGNLHHRLGDPCTARGLIERAINLLDTSGRCARARVSALSDLALIGFGQAASDAVGLIRRSADSARATGDRRMIAVSLAKAAKMLAQLGCVREAVSLLDEAEAAADGDHALRRHYLPRRAFVRLRIGDVAQARRDTQQVLAELGRTTAYEQVGTLLTYGWAQALGTDLDAARHTLTEATALARQRQVMVLAPDLLLAHAYVRRAEGQHAAAVRLVCDATRHSLSHHDLPTGVSALNLALALAHDTANPFDVEIAAAVRECRLACRLPAWPLTEHELASYESEPPPASPPPQPGHTTPPGSAMPPPGRLDRGLFGTAAELVLAHLATA